jgi:ubiquinone biosynthesis UbiH/UbiF/VisC/COQ6 family hydroxylase
MKKDVIIIGAGPSGLALACLLNKLNLSVTIVEKAPEASLKTPAYDGRETALTHPSKDLLEKIGAWKNIDSKSISPIKEAKVLNGFSTYSLDFKNSNPNTDALGYLVSNHSIRKALYEEFEKLSNVELITDELVEDIECSSEIARVVLSNGKVLEASLIAAADSRFSKSRSKMGISADMHDFAKTMIVCKMEHENDHKNIALECFYHDRVLAVLPLHGKTSSIVITASKNQVEELINLSEEEFSANITNYFEDKLGKLKLSSKRYPYPLVGVHANKFTSTRFALIGDAAVGMHPVTAHGFNLGLLGQEILCNEIKEALRSAKDIGSNQVLTNYSTKHSKETKILYHGTNTIVGIFTSNKASIKMLRSIMLRAANSKFLPFKSMIANRLTGNKKSEGIFSLFKKF